MRFGDGRAIREFMRCTKLVEVIRIYGDGRSGALQMSTCLAWGPIPLKLSPTSQRL